MSVSPNPLGEGVYAKTLERMRKTQGNKGFQEFPKCIQLQERDPKTGLDYVIVDNLREEMAVAASGMAAQPKPDPVTEERNTLAQTVAQLQAQLAAKDEELAKAKAGAIVNAPQSSPAKISKSPSDANPLKQVVASTKMQQE